MLASRLCSCLAYVLPRRAQRRPDVAPPSPSHVAWRSFVTASEAPRGQQEPIETVAKLIRSGEANRIIVLTGAGVSVSAGIPDFRTPGTGLYDNLQEYGLPYAEAIFDLDFFRTKPDPFYRLCQELWPGRYAPTPTHHFISLLHDKGVLLRCFTQNIDSLETAAGLPPQTVRRPLDPRAACRPVHAACRPMPATCHPAHAAHRPAPPRWAGGGKVRKDDAFFTEA